MRAQLSGCPLSVRHSLLRMVRCLRYAKASFPFDCLCAKAQLAERAAGHSSKSLAEIPASSFALRLYVDCICDVFRGLLSRCFGFGSLEHAKWDKSPAKRQVFFNLGRPKGPFAFRRYGIGETRKFALRTGGAFAATPHVESAN